MKDLASLLETACRNGFCIEDSTGRTDCANIRELSISLAERLISYGRDAAEPVILLVDNSALDIVGFNAIWRAGMVAVPLHQTAPTEVITRMQRTVGARFTIKGGVCEYSGELPPPSTSLPEDAALIIFTSGSTGQPKGVILGHRSLVGKIEVLKELLQFNATDKVVVPLQLTFVFGLWVSLLALKAGATLVLKPRFSVSGMSDDLASGASIIAVVPTMLRSMSLDTAPLAVSLRQILTGGEPLLSALAEKVLNAFPQTSIFDLYGSTETGSCDFYLGVSDSRVTGTIGTPTAKVSYRIVSDDEHDCRDEEIGELRIATPFRMLGYFGDRTATDAAFDSKHFFRTGDLARRRVDGLVELAGRRKEIISRGGIKISPLEIDTLFAKHPDVLATLCGGIPDSRLGETVHVLVVPRAGAKLEANALLDWAATRIEKQKLPNGIHFVDSLPLGRTGKTDRNGIKDIVLALSA